MPKTTFSTDNVRQSFQNFPKLKLEHGEVARIVCIEDGPVFEWVHQMQKPRISPVTNKPVMETRKRKDDSEYQDFAMEFLGSPICLGDPDVLQEDGVDPKRCPICKLSTTDEAFRAPQRRFAIHILKYKTKQGKAEVVEPFSVECLAWVMSDNRFGELAGIFEEWAPEGEQPDPRKIDLILGPCVNAGFQNYKIAVGQRCEMLQSKERLNRALETYKNDHAQDLSSLCGRRTERRWIDQMVDEIRDRYAEIREGSGEQLPADVTDTLDSSLLDTAETKPARKASNGSKPDREFVPTPADAPPGEGDPLNEFKPGGSKQDVPVEPDTSGEVATAKSDVASGEDVDFDELMKTLEDIK